MSIMLLSFLSVMFPSCLAWIISATVLPNPSLNTIHYENNVNKLPSTHGAFSHEDKTAAANEVNKARNKLGILIININRHVNLLAIIWKD